MREFTLKFGPVTMAPGGTSGSPHVITKRKQPFNFSSSIPCYTFCVSRTHICNRVQSHSTDRRLDKHVSEDLRANCPLDTDIPQ